MNKSENTFRDKLLDMEKPNSNYREKYEKEVKAMLEKKLNYLWRVGFVVLGLVGLLVAISFAEMASSRGGDDSLRLFARLVTVPGAVLGLAWSVLMGWVAVTGKLNLRTQPARMAAIGVALGFFFVAYFMFRFVVPITVENPTDYRSILGVQLALIGFFFVVTVGICLLLRIAYRTEFKTREKLLEIEYRIAELAEKVEGKSEK